MVKIKNKTNKNSLKRTSLSNKKIKVLNSFSLLGLSAFFSDLNTNKLFIGIMMIFMNLGSRFIELKLTKGQEMIIKNIARELLIFTIAFMATKDILTALIVTAVFIILSNFVFNEKCKYNLLPEKYKKMENILDLNNDGEVSDEELEKAQKILQKANDNTKLNNKISMLNHMVTY